MLLRGVKVLVAGLIASIAFACTINTGTTDSGSTSGGGTSSKIYCQKNTASGACHCATTDPGPQEDWEYTDDCDSLPSGAACCYDVNGDGETTSCDCYVPSCAADSDTNFCWCRFYDVFIVGKNRDNEEKVSSCSGKCCKTDDSCDCNSFDERFCDGELVDSCTAPTKYECGGASKQATSCAGLKWKGK